MSGVGGYVRRKDRHFIPPVPDDGVPRCGFCHARLDVITPWNQPHICREITFGTPALPLRFETFRDEP